MAATKTVILILQSPPSDTSYTIDDENAYIVKIGRHVYRGQEAMHRINAYSLPPQPSPPSQPPLPPPSPSGSYLAT